MSPNWNDDIKDYFTQMDAGCMATVTYLTPPLDLASYQSVKNFVDASPDNKQMIQEVVESGSMPKGGPPWPPEKVATFKKWIEIGCPES